MLITKKAILNTLPAFRKELEEHATTQRHRDRLDNILHNLVKKGLVTELRLEKGEEVTVHYSKAA